MTQTLQEHPRNGRLPRSWHSSQCDHDPSIGLKGELDQEIVDSFRQDSDGLLQPVSANLGSHLGLQNGSNLVESSSAEFCCGHGHALKTSSSHKSTPNCCCATGAQYSSRQRPACHRQYRQMLPTPTVLRPSSGPTATVVCGANVGKSLHCAHKWLVLPPSHDYTVLVHDILGEWVTARLS
jgi:hypothetical protein